MRVWPLAFLIVLLSGLTIRVLAQNEDMVWVQNDNLLIVWDGESRMLKINDEEQAYIVSLDLSSLYEDEDFPEAPRISVNPVDPTRIALIVPDEQLWLAHYLVAEHRIDVVEKHDLSKEFLNIGVLKWNADGTQLALLGANHDEGQTLILWTVADQSTKTYTYEGYDFEALAWHPKHPSQLLKAISNGKNSILTLVDVSTAEILREWVVPNEANAYSVSEVVWKPDGTQFASFRSGSTKGYIRLHTLDTGEYKAEIRTENIAGIMKWSLSGPYLAINGFPSFEVWDAETLELLESFPTETIGQWAWCSDNVLKIERSAEPYGILSLSTYRFGESDASALPTLLPTVAPIPTLAPTPLGQ